LHSQSIILEQFDGLDRSDGSSNSLDGCKTDARAELMMLTMIDAKILSENPIQSVRTLTLDAANFNTVKGNKLLQVRAYSARSGCQQHPLFMTKVQRVESVSEVSNVSAATINNSEQLHRRNNQKSTTTAIGQGKLDNRSGGRNGGEEMPDRSLSTTRVRKMH
jgi:hypothetical protein